MKSQYLLTLEDFSSETSLTEELIKTLISMQVLYTAQKKPVMLFFSRDIEKGKKIANMLTMGYQIAEIRRIIREIGLPGEDERDEREKLYPIGEFCTRFGLNPRQIKYWEQMGLLYPASRSKGGIRLYNELLLRHIRFIQSLQGLGFPLEEIKDIIDRKDTEAVEKKIAHLNEIIREVKPLLKNMKAIK